MQGGLGLSYRYCPLCARELVPVRDPGDGRQRLGCPTGHFTHYEGMFAAVNALVWQGEQVVLQQRAIPPGEGLWDLPGGYLEKFESPEGGAAREVQEETGLTVRVGRLLAARAGSRSPVLILYYEAEPTGGRLQASPESLAVNWFHWRAIPWEQIAFANVREILRECIRQRFGANPE